MSLFVMNKVLLRDVVDMDHIMQCAIIGLNSHWVEYNTCGGVRDMSLVVNDGMSRTFSSGNFPTHIWEE